MAEGVVSNLVANAVESLGKSAFKEAASSWGARKDVKKLESSMRMIQARVRDAERRREDENNELIRIWVRRLRQVLYRAEDLFDDVYSSDRNKERIETSMIAKVGMLFSRYGPFSFNMKLAHEIKSIRKELDGIKLDMAELNLMVVLPAQQLQLPVDRLMMKRETASFVNTQDVVGRGNDKNKIIQMLFDPKYDGESISVIPIVGFGGIGKTTLAQLVFNDERVNRHFDLTRWAYVPEIDNQIVTMGKVFESFTGNDYHNLPLEVIKRGIINSIQANRYLLVLDDLWDEGGDRLVDLMNLLRCGRHGSKVIITTRSNIIAKLIGTVEVAHELGTLLDDQSWNLFMKMASRPGQGSNHFLFSTIGKEIVKMCGNVPLAVKVVGGFLRCRDAEKEWLQVRDQLSKAKFPESSDIMPILKISYDYLPPTLKQCFAYCSLFPKGHLFEKDDLVHLWMAQGYVEPPTEEGGDQYFSELVSRNLFQDPKVSAEGDNVVTCRMHDLLHDLAKLVADNESMVLGDPSMRITDALVHVNLTASRCTPPSLLIDRPRRLRSLFCVLGFDELEQLVPKLLSLRVLSIDHFYTRSYTSLRHLRYLNLGTNNYANHLPPSITRLENLQTLNLAGYKALKELPRDFAKLANLRHLLIHKDALISFPAEFVKLTSLTALNRFTVGRNNSIDSLPALNLRGKLQVTFQNWHPNTILEVHRTNLKHNQQLTSLTLSFSSMEAQTPTPTLDEMNKMLTCLELPPNLRYLEVREYQGGVIPLWWLNGLSRLVSIRLSGCTRCKVLPQLSRLPHLKSVELISLHDLEYVEDIDDGDIIASSVDLNAIYFPSLEFLRLKRMSKMKGWTRPSNDGGDGERRRHFSFPHLLNMEVFHCNELISMPVAPKLHSLDARHVNGKMFESKLRPQEASSSSSSSSSPALFTSLEKLNIIDAKLVSLSFSSSLSKLEKVEIMDCGELRSLMFRSLNSIHQLSIIGCRALRNISQGLQHLSVLKTLVIRHCDDILEGEEGNSAGGWHGLRSLCSLELRGINKMKKLPQGIASLTTLEKLSLIQHNNLITLPEDIASLSSLRDLRIANCPQLESLPASLQQITSLQTLDIEGCSNLELTYTHHIPQVRIV